ncbi:MAG: ArnT family glycosyltransferase [Thermodesulfobacteriota bacterium]
MLLIYHIGFLMGGVGLLIFFLGHMGLMGVVSLSLITLLASAALIVLIRGWLKGTPRQRGREWWTLAPFLLFTLLLLPLILLPPTGRDALIVHLALPKLFLQAGKIFEVPFMSFSYMPMNTDLLYLIPMAFGSDTAPKLVHFSFAVLTGLLLSSYLSGRVGRGYGLLGFFIYLTTPIVVNLSTMAYIDLSLAFYSTLALIALLRWREEEYAARWLIYSAVATGLALGAKYSALVVLFIMCVSAVYLYSRGTGDQGGAVKRGLLYLAVALLVFSPWLIKNIALTGNPLYPLAQGLFQARLGGGEGFHISALPPLLMRKLLYGEDIWYILLIPLRIFWEGQDGSHRYFDGLMNPFYLIFIPLAFFGGRRRELGMLAFFSCFFFLIALFTVDIVTRYLLPIIPVIIIFTVIGFSNLMGMRRVRYLALLFMTGLFVFNGWYIVNLYQRYRPMGYISGSETREEYLTRRLPDYAAIQFGNAHLPDDARVMLIFAGERGYYWEREYFYGSRGGGYFIRAVRRSADERGLKGWFKEMGATHLFMRDDLLIRFAGDNLDRKGLTVFERFYRGELRRLYMQNSYSLYEIK